MLPSQTVDLTHPGPSDGSDLRPTQDHGPELSQEHGSDLFPGPWSCLMQPEKRIWHWLKTLSLVERTWSVMRQRGHSQVTNNNCGQFPSRHQNVWKVPKRFTGYHCLPKHSNMYLLSQRTVGCEKVIVLNFFASRLSSSLIHN